jgi:hypothetical protein
MFRIDRLPLEQVRHVEYCSRAPHGSILQGSYKDGIFVGVRTFFGSATGGAEAMLLVGGADHGKILSLVSMKDPSALDISALVRFVASDPQPFVIDRLNIPVGALLLEPKSGTFLAAGTVIHSASQQTPGFVYLFGKDKDDRSAGSFLDTINPGRWRGISKSFTLERVPFNLPASG